MWSRYPVEARLVEVLVGVPPEKWKWCQDLVGTRRKAIEVKINETLTIYVDNQDGRALQVFLKGRAPLPGFRWVPVYRVYEDPDAKPSYQAALD